MLTRLRGSILVAALVVLVTNPVAAQVSPTSPPHPTMPWNFYSKREWGEVTRYIAVPPQAMTIEVPVAVPAGVPPQTQQQVVEIPGYTVIETTLGFVYPERWTLVQTGPGVYQWQLVPSEFRKK